MEIEALKNLPELKSLCKTPFVKRMSLFGSAAKGKSTSTSDVDLLVLFNYELPRLDYADNYFAFLEKLQKLLAEK